MTTETELLASIARKLLVGALMGRRDLGIDPDDGNVVVDAFVYLTPEETAVANKVTAEAGRPR